MRLSQLALKFAATLVLSLAVCGAAHSASLAVIDADNSERSARVTALAIEFISRTGQRAIDPQIAASALKAFPPADLKNLTTDAAAARASAIGCDAMLIVSASTIRRSSFERKTYYESIAAFFLVSGRTGSLLRWRNFAAEGDDATAAEKDLDRDLANSVPTFVSGLRDLLAADAADSKPPPMEVVPDDLALSPGLTAPIPYRRIKPEYPDSAAAYAIEATVEIEADVAADGSISRTAVKRWAGFGLDESAATAVRKMNWRPAMRNGKPIAMRVLLRYNFKRQEKKPGDK